MAPLKSKPEGGTASSVSRRLTLLREIVRTTALDLDLSAMVERIGTSLRSHLQLDLVGWGLLSESREPCSLRFVQKAEGILERETELLRGSLWLEETLRHGRPTAVPPVSEALALLLNRHRLHGLCIPIRYAGNPLAVLVLGRRESWDSETERTFLEVVADQLAATLERWKRVEELTEHAALMEMMSQISREALSRDDLHGSLQQVTQYIAQRFQVAAASILLLNSEGTHFVSEAYSGSIELQWPEERNWPITVGVCGRCARTGEPQHITDTDLDPDYVSGNESVQSEYIVPIRYRDRILGVLNLESVRRNTFTPYVQLVFRNLANQIAGAIRLAAINEKLGQTNSDLAVANQRLSELSYIDGLTSIANRRRFDRTLKEEWNRACRMSRSLSVILADLDCFKALNDSHGHAYGDDCLRRIATCLGGSLQRSGDLVARYGGEEFGILLPETEATAALKIAERLRRSIEDLEIPHGSSTASDVVTLSLGVASARARASADSRDLIEAADAALYRAKNAGRNQVAIRRLSHGI